MANDGSGGGVKMPVHGAVSSHCWSISTAPAVCRLSASKALLPPPPILFPASQRWLRAAVAGECGVQLQDQAEWNSVSDPVLLVSLSVEKSKPLAAPGPSAAPCCPDGWIGYRGKCYYFSETDGNWTYSQSRCSALNASLAAIDSEQEKDFLLRYKGFLDRWIGLQREPGQPWRWPNGTEFDNRFPIRGGGDCVFLIDEDWFGSSRCRTWRRWICSKPDARTMGKG
ncbi:C-type lectin domain family 2 member D-like [Mauremys reevesii]|uniref:C-type lectin domain family 2 member D-like n=1 Tax=Mauremys reevesii TaxID=260615 RepID=UPI00193F32CB|nr:C-type lectin domain family 2 member D-like [Mauremys reevesii]